MKILLSINCPDWECVNARMRVADEQLRDVVEWLHLDIADGVFTFGKSWGDPQAWHRRNRHFKTEAHLMVEEPEKVAEDWLKAGVNRLIVHLESMNRLHLQVQHLQTLCRAYGAELGLAVNPETPIEALKPFLKGTSYFQVFAQAYPGPSGQKFLPLVLPKIRSLRALAPHATIEIDGGMVPETIRQVKAAGADAVISGSYIFENADPLRTYQELQSI